MLAVAVAALVASLTPVTGFGSNPGALDMFVHVPDGFVDMPVVVLLHGCSQGPDDYDDETGFVALADLHGFALVVPGQRVTNNASRCFNWFEPGDIARGEGEALSIREMIDHAVATFALDDARVFVTGLSAGGAMTAALLAAYPDVFAGGAVVAGVPFGCASGFAEAFSCMAIGSALDDDALGDVVRVASTHSGPWPRVAVWHGTSDFTVDDENASDLVRQWTNVHGISSTSTSTDVFGVATRTRFGTPMPPLVERVSLAGMGHGIPVAPDLGCGTSAPFVLDVGVCAAHHIAAFFGVAPPVDGDDADADAGATDGGDDGDGASDDDAGGDDARDDDAGCACVSVGSAPTPLIAMCLALALLVRRRRLVVSSA